MSSEKVKRIAHCSGLAGVVLVLGCADAASAKRAFSEQFPDSSGVVDPVLARARLELRTGRLSATTRAQLMASDDPEHARARRILSEMERLEDAESSADSEPPDLALPDTSRALVIPAAAVALPEAASATSNADRRKTSSQTPKEQPAASSSSSVPPPPPVAQRPRLRGIGLRGSSGGATLSLDAGTAVSVGVAQQPTSGIVRLLVDASADVRALKARPRIAGARVSSVKRLSKSVVVTVELDPGWQLAQVHKTRHGARVQLRRPG